MQQCKNHLEVPRVPCHALQEMAKSPEIDSFEQKIAEDQARLDLDKAAKELDLDNIMGTRLAMDPAAPPTDFKHVRFDEAFKAGIAPPPAPKRVKLVRQETNPSPVIELGAKPKVSTFIIAMKLKELVKMLRHPKRGDNCLCRQCLSDDLDEFAEMLTLM